MGILAEGSSGDILIPKIVPSLVSREEFNKFVTDNKATYINFRGAPGNVSNWLTDDSDPVYTDEAYNCCIGVVGDPTKGVKVFHFLPSEVITADGTLADSRLHDFNSGQGIDRGLAIANPRNQFITRHRQMLSQYPLEWVDFPDGFEYACLGYKPATGQLVYAFHNDYSLHLTNPAYD